VGFKFTPERGGDYSGSMAVLTGRVANGPKDEAVELCGEGSDELGVGHAD
jgi:hypothetical protein